uniref:Ubiquinol-cytochrome c chaperone domain-containing protein n=1 Tax=Meloidogyne javanica TaxID=6303 RepID=A0A915MT50_MELJA
MILTRLQQTMEVYSYCYVKKMITQNFHHYKTNRYNTVYVRKDQPSLKLKRRSNFRQLYYDVYMNSLFEYDDGFLGDDKYLAAAVWRALYLMEDEADIIYIERVVRYIRAT